MRWMEVAWGELGVAEVSGAGANPRILAFFSEAGHPEIASDEVHWCAAALAYCLSKGGVSLAAVPKHDRLRARAYAAIGTHIDYPRVGAIAILRRGNDPAAGHCGIVSGWTETHIKLLSGNVANAFTDTLFPRHDVIALRWPQAVTAAELDAAGSRITAAAGQQGRDGIKAAAVPAAGSVALPTEMPLGGLEAVAGKAASLQGTVETLAQFVAFAGRCWPLLAILLAGYWVARMIWQAMLIRQWRVEDGSTGAHTGRVA